MSYVKINWHDEELVEAIKRMRRHGGSFQPVFKGLKRLLRLNLKHHAAKFSGPDGKWPRRSAATLERYEAKTTQRKSLKGKSGPVQRKSVRRRKRKLLGKLPNAVTIKERAMGIAAVSKVPWSDVHNVGGRVGRGAVLPQREFLFMSPAFVETAVDRMAEFVVREFGR